MVKSSNIRIHYLVATALLATACSDGRSVDNAAPRITDIPQQATLGGSTFSLDLSAYVTDRESSTLTYTVVSGGGSFADSTYSNMFDTIGEYEVAFEVTDGPKTESGTFTVQVTSANLVPLTEDGASLVLLDSSSNAFKRVTSTVPQPSILTQVGSRMVVYRLGSSGGDWVYDTYTGEKVRLGADVAGGGTYVTKTSDGKIVYTTGTSPEQTIWVYNPTTTIARDVADGGLSTLTVLINSDDLVFYENGVGGQGDIEYYNPSEDVVVSVSAEATDEQLQAVLPNGGVVFSRVGESGESDLYYYRVGTGLVEVGSDISALAARDKTFQVNDNNSKVVFTALNGADLDLYFWNPVDGQTTAINTAVGTVFGKVGAGNEVVYNSVVTPSVEEDILYYDLDDGQAATLRDSTDIGVVAAIVNDGTTSWALVSGSAAPNDAVAVSLAAAPDVQTWSASGAVNFVDSLANGDFVAQQADGSEFAVFDVSDGTWDAPITTSTGVFGGAGLAAGDFVYSVSDTGAKNLLMWDESAGTSVTIATGADEIESLAVTLDGTLLFTRKETSLEDRLYVWDGTTVTQLTDQDTDGIYHHYEAAGSAFAVTR